MLPTAAAGAQPSSGGGTHRPRKSCRSLSEDQKLRTAGAWSPGKRPQNVARRLRSWADTPACVARASQCTRSSAGVARNRGAGLLHAHASQPKTAVAFEHERAVDDLEGLFPRGAIDEL